MVILVELNSEDNHLHWKFLVELGVEGMEKMSVCVGINSYS